MKNLKNENLNFHQNDLGRFWTVSIAFYGGRMVSTLLLIALHATTPPRVAAVHEIGV